MANAKCRDCGKNVSWSASRGSKLADCRCPECGGRLIGHSGQTNWYQADIREIVRLIWERAPKKREVTT